MLKYFPGAICFSEKCCAAAAEADICLIEGAEEPVEDGIPRICNLNIKPIKFAINYAIRIPIWSLGVYFVWKWRQIGGSARPPPDGPGNPNVPPFRNILYPSEGSDESGSGDDDTPETLTDRGSGPSSDGGGDSGGGDGGGDPPTDQPPPNCPPCCPPFRPPN